MWGASYLLIYVNAQINHSIDWRRQPKFTPSVYIYPVSFRMSSFTCGVIFLHIPVSLEGMLTAKTPRHLCPAYAVTLVYLILSSSLAPYSIPPSDSILTGCGVCFSKEAGISFAWIRAFNALDRWLVPIGFAFDETSLRLPRHFFHI